jgi:protein gp37
VHPSPPVRLLEFVVDDIGLEPQAEVRILFWCESSITTITAMVPDWLNAGAESGHGARSCDLDWIRSLRGQCIALGVQFFFRQMAENGRNISLPKLDGRSWTEIPGKRGEIA